jgi:hypothetical protein
LTNQVATMLRDMSRSTVIAFWFAAVALIGVAVVTFGATVTAATAAMLFALSLVPPVIVFLLWPSAQPPTAAEVLRGRDTP